MKVDTYKLGVIEKSELKYAVICANYKKKWVFVRHKERDTWEIPGGRKEIFECIDETAKRELFEETGAKIFEIKAVCDYSVTNNGVRSYGRLYWANIEEFGELPQMEIEEVKLFESLPNNLTYPFIQPYLYNEIIKLELFD